MSENNEDYREDSNEEINDINDIKIENVDSEINNLNDNIYDEDSQKEIIEVLNAQLQINSQLLENSNYHLPFQCYGYGILIIFFVSTFILYEIVQNRDHDLY